MSYGKRLHFPHVDSEDFIDKEPQPHERFSKLFDSIMHPPVVSISVIILIMLIIALWLIDFANMLFLVCCILDESFDQTKTCPH